MKKSTRIVLWCLLVVGVGILVYQVIPFKNKAKLFEQPAVEGVLDGTVVNSSYKYLLVNLFEQDSTIYITEGNTTRSEGLHVFDTVDIVDGRFSYTYRQKEAFFFPRLIYLANDSGPCELVCFQNPYFEQPRSMGAISMERGAHITLTIDGNRINEATVKGSAGTNALFKREADNDAKARAAAKALIQKKQAAEEARHSDERAKQVQDSIQKAKTQYDTATEVIHGRKSKIYLKPKYRPAQ